MRVPLRSRWASWTNEWAYCWGLAHCHGAGSQWTAHPRTLSRNTITRHVTHPSSADRYGYQCACKTTRFSPWGKKKMASHCKVTIRKASSLSLPSLKTHCAAGSWWSMTKPHTHTQLNRLLCIQTIHVLLWCCCANNITGATDGADDRKRGAVLTGRQAVNTLAQKQHVRRNDTCFRNTSNRW